MVSKKDLGRIPAFESEREEAEFWAIQDSMEYIDWDQAERVKPKTITISIRLPEFLWIEIKRQAEEKSMTYRNLIRDWLVEKSKGAG